MNKTEFHDIVSTWDPFGLIHEGQPMEVYDTVADMVHSYYKENPGVDEVQLGNKICELFTGHFGPRPDEFKEECLGIATRLTITGVE